MKLHSIGCLVAILVFGLVASGQEMTVMDEKVLVRQTQIDCDGVTVSFENTYYLDSNQRWIPSIFHSGLTVNGPLFRGGSVTYGAETRPDSNGESFSLGDQLPDEKEFTVVSQFRDQTLLDLRITLYLKKSVGTSSFGAKCTGQVTVGTFRQAISANAAVASARTQWTLKEPLKSGWTTKLLGSQLTLGDLLTNSNPVN